MNVAGAKAGAEFGEDPLEIRARCASQSGAGSRWYAPSLMSADAEIRPDEDMNRRMFDPICSELFEVEERHLVDIGVGVAAGGGKEAIDVSPTVCVSYTRSGGCLPIAEPAPGMIPGAGSS